jgi:hypothetical protein
MYIVGQGYVLLHELKSRNHGVLSRLSDAELNIIFNNRVVNLKKVYPYIPDTLNRVLLHFSNGANWFYEQVGQLIHDLRPAIEDIR